jgi:hypothetical protein
MAMPSERLFIIQLNIEHFRGLLDGEIDETRRATIQRLIADEEAKLKALRDDPHEPDAQA